MQVTTIAAHATMLSSHLTEAFKAKRRPISGDNFKVFS
jgi:hypothetical protein